MSASPDGPPIAERVRVLDTLSELTRRFEALAERLIAGAVEPLRRGLPPDSGLLEDCQTAASEYAAATTRAADLGFTADLGLGLHALTTFLRERMAEEEWDQFRTASWKQFDNIARLAHASGVAPPYLLALHTRAAEMRAELDASKPGQSSAAWCNRIRPFQDLWQLLTDPESLSEPEAEAALGRVEESFGRAVVSAVLTRKLTVAPPPSPSEQTVAADAPPAADVVQPERILTASSDERQPRVGPLFGCSAADSPGGAGPCSPQAGGNPRCLWLLRPSRHSHRPPEFAS
ncbi:MAG: hypothetical protein U0792_06795 [Gemmataceae bacterium]